MLTAYTPAPFALTLSPYVQGETRHGRQALFTRLEHDDAGRYCIIHLLLVPYALHADGTLGDELTSGNFTRKPDTLTADNRKLVDRSQNGKILAVRNYRKADGTLTTDAEWAADVARVQADPELDGMYQGDFFLWLRDHQPLVIGQMIRDYIQQADAAGDFDR